jgi:hypothetical protein
MTYTTLTNSISRQDTSVSGVVLAVSPDNSTLVLTDPVRHLTYLYSTSGGSVTTEYGGVGTAASFSPDSTTVYITTTDNQLLVHSTYIGWTAVPLTVTPTGVAVTVPNAGVYLAGSPVDVRTNCPNTTIVNPNPANPIEQTTTNVYYPDVGPVPVNVANSTNPGLIADYNQPTNDIASTNDGLHELTASIASGTSPAAFTDIVTNRKSGGCTGPNKVTFSSTPGPAIPFTVANPTAITAVLPTTDSAYAFVTYTGTGGVVPEYTLSTSTLSNIALQTTSAGTPIAPVAGVVSSDDQTFYVGTSGDNLVHRLARGTAGFTDSLTPLTPLLPSITGSGYAAPNLIVQKPRKANS